MKVRLLERFLPGAALGSEVKKMEQTEWFPVVEFDGVEYVVDVMR